MVQDRDFNLLNKGMIINVLKLNHVHANKEACCSNLRNLIDVQ